MMPTTRHLLADGRPTTPGPGSARGCRRHRRSHLDSPRRSGRDGKRRSPTPQITERGRAHRRRGQSDRAAPNPTGILGPSTTLPANPTSTVVTPRRGRQLRGHLHRPLRQHRHPADHLHVGRQPGRLVHPARRRSPARTRSSPVVDPSGDIYLSSYYGQLVDKFSPTGTLLWSVDPDGDNPTAIYSVGTGSSFEWWSAWCRTRRRAWCSTSRPGRSPGSFPLIDELRLRDPGVRRRPALLGQRLRGDGQLDRQGALRVRVVAHRGQRGPHRLAAPSSTIRARPSRGPTGRSTRPTRSTRWRPRRRPGSSRGARPSAGDLNFGRVGLWRWSAPPSTSERASRSTRRPTPSRRSRCPP